MNDKNTWQVNKETGEGLTLRKGDYALSTSPNLSAKKGLHLQLSYGNGTAQLFNIPLVKRGALSMVPVAGEKDQYLKCTASPDSQNSQVFYWVWLKKLDGKWMLQINKEAYAFVWEVVSCPASKSILDAIALS